MISGVLARSGVDDAESLLVLGIWVGRAQVGIRVMSRVVRGADGMCRCIVEVRSTLTVVWQAHPGSGVHVGALREWNGLLMGEKSSVVIVKIAVLQLMISPMGIAATWYVGASRYGHSIADSNITGRVHIYWTRYLVGLVADVFFASSAANCEPSKAAADSFDKIPWIEGVNESFGPVRSANIRGVRIREETRGGLRCDDCRAADVVDLPREGEEMED